MGYLETSPLPPRTHEIPGVVKTQLSTARMDELLYGSGRVYTQDEEPTGREDDAGKPWGRVVVMIGKPLFPRAQEPMHRGKLVRLVIRAEVNDPAPGFDYRQALEAILEEVFKRLEGWTPTGLSKASVSFPVYKRGRVTEDAIRDDRRGLWVMTDEYKLLIEPV